MGVVTGGTGPSAHAPRKPITCKNARGRGASWITCLSVPDPQIPGKNVPPPSRGRDLESQAPAQRPERRAPGWVGPCGWAGLTREEPMRGSDSAPGAEPAVTCTPQTGSGGGGEATPEREEGGGAGLRRVSDRRGGAGPSPGEPEPAGGECGCGAAVTAPSPPALQPARAEPVSLPAGAPSRAPLPGHPGLPGRPAGRVRVRAGEPAAAALSLPPLPSRSPRPQSLWGSRRRGGPSAARSPRGERGCGKVGEKKRPMPAAGSR